MKWVYRLKNDPSVVFPWPDVELGQFVALPCCEKLCTVVAYKRISNWEQKALHGGSVMTCEMELVSVLSISEVAS